VDYSIAAKDLEFCCEASIQNGVAAMIVVVDVAISIDDRVFVGKDLYLFFDRDARKVRRVQLSSHPVDQDVRWSLAMVNEMLSDMVDCLENCRVEDCD
jgi:hypothetical protein